MQLVKAERSRLEADVKRMTEEINHLKQTAAQAADESGRLVDQVDQLTADMEASRQAASKAQEDVQRENSHLQGEIKKMADEMKWKTVSTTMKAQQLVGGTVENPEANRSRRDLILAIIRMCMVWASYSSIPVTPWRRSWARSGLTYATWARFFRAIVWAWVVL